MRFLNSRHSPPREFSLTELVSAIDELQRRRQTRDEKLDGKETGADHRMASSPRDTDFGSSQELTE